MTDSTKVVPTVLALTGMVGAIYAYYRINQKHKLPNVIEEG